jgi:hypothetical protein
MYNLLIAYYFSILFDVFHEKFGLIHFAIAGIVTIAPDICASIVEPISKTI